MSESADISTDSAVLLVDGDECVRTMLATTLTQQGCEVLATPSSEDALVALDQTSFDIAIIEQQRQGGKPRQDSEVVRRVRERAGNRFVSIVVVTDGDDIDSRLRAFDEGCDDCWVKPIHPLELQARVHSLLARRREHVELARANQHLRALQQKKQELAALVVHDLRNPLSAIQGNIQLLLEDLGTEQSDELVRDALGDCYSLAGRALFLVAGLLDVEELAEGLLTAVPQVVDVAELLQRATPHHTATIRMRELSLEFDVPRGLTAQIDPDLVGRLVENLLDNAVRYAPRRGRVAVRGQMLASTYGDTEVLELRVGNNGPPVPDRERQRIFGRYYCLEARRAGARANRGLGLYFCKLAASAHGGTIDVVETDELPTCFVVTLPQHHGELSKRRT